MMHLVLCSGFIGPLKQCSSTIVNSGYSSLSLGLSLGALCQPYQSDADLGAGEDTALLQSTLKCTVMCRDAIDFELEELRKKARE